MHRQGTANVAAAAKEAGARELIYVSAMGATPDANYPYLHSKHQAEQEVVNSGLDYTILRPSVIFGEGDEFLTALAGLVRIGPVTPVIGGGRNRMQPVAADDVARCVAASVGNSTVKRKTLNLGGPHRLSYNALLDEVGLAMGPARPPGAYPNALGSACRSCYGANPAETSGNDRPAQDAGHPERVRRTRFGAVIRVYPQAAAG